MSRTLLIQVGQALSQRGIEHIAAYSPHARCRSERAFGMLQDRLPKDLAFAGIATAEAANRWLTHTNIGEHNAAFAAATEQEGWGFVPDRAGLRREILCAEHERVAGNDNTVKWRNLRLPLPPSRLRPHFVRASVRVRELSDGQIVIFLGPHRLADYDAQVVVIDTPGIGA